MVGGVYEVGIHEDRNTFFGISGKQQRGIGFARPALPGLAGERGRKALAAPIDPSISRG